MPDLSEFNRISIKPCIIYGVCKEIWHPLDPTNERAGSVFLQVEAADFRHIKCTKMYSKKRFSIHFMFQKSPASTWGKKIRWLVGSSDTTFCYLSFVYIKWGASSLWSSSLFCSMRNLDEMTIVKTHPTLLMWVTNKPE